MRSDARTDSGPGSLAGFAAALLTTRECRSGMGRVLSSVLSRWEAGSALKKTVTGPVRWMVSRGLSPQGGASGEESLASLLADPGHAVALGQQLPLVVGGIASLAHTLVLHLETLPGEKRGELFEGLFGQVEAAKLGETVTSLARMAGELSLNDPTFFSRKGLALLRAFLETTDAGEVKGFLEQSREDMAALATGASALAFEFPAKLVLLLSAIPGACNLLLIFVEDLLRRFTELPPDILADILLSFFKEIDGRTLGQLVGRLAEIVRLVHTGSALIGEAGAPQFTADLRETLRDAVAEVDPRLCFKAYLALIDGREALLTTAGDVAGEHPELLRLWVEHLFAPANSRSRVLRHRLELLGDLPEAEAAGALAAGVSRWNGDELAEVVNLACRMANTLNDVNPGQVEKSLGDFFASLDLPEVEAAVGWLAPDFFRGARPLIRAVAPSVVRELAGCLSPADDGNDDAIAEALGMLRRALTAKEAI